MAWGDVMAGIGAAAGGVNQVYQAERERQSKEKINELREEVRQMIAQAGNKSREGIADVKARTDLEKTERNIKAKQVLGELRASTDLTIATNHDEKTKQIADALNQNRIDINEATLLNRLTLAEWNNEAAQKRTETTAGATKYAADVGAASRQEVANITQAGEKERADKDRQVRMWTGDLRYRYPHGPGAWLLGDVKPTGPSFNAWQSGKTDSGDFDLDLAAERSGQAAGAHRPSRGNVTGFSPSLEFSPSGSMPPMGPAVPPPAAPPAAPPPAAAAMSPSGAPPPELPPGLPGVMPTNQLKADLFGGFQKPSALPTPTGIPAAPAAPVKPAAPVGGATLQNAPPPGSYPPGGAESEAVEYLKKQKSRELMTQLQAAKDKGDFKRMRVLQQQLEALLQ